MHSPASAAEGPGSFRRARRSSHGSHDGGERLGSGERSNVGSSAVPPTISSNSSDSDRQPMIPAEELPYRSAWELRVLQRVSDSDCSVSAGGSPVRARSSATARDNADVTASPVGDAESTPSSPEAKHDGGGGREARAAGRQPLPRQGQHGAAEQTHALAQGAGVSPVHDSTLLRAEAVEGRGAGGRSLGGSGEGSRGGVAESSGESEDDAGGVPEELRAMHREVMAAMRAVGEDFCARRGRRRARHALARWRSAARWWGRAGSSDSEGGLGAEVSAARQALAAEFARGMREHSVRRKFLVWAGVAGGRVAGEEAGVAGALSEREGEEEESEEEEGWVFPMGLVELEIEVSHRAARAVVEAWRDAAFGARCEARVRRAREAREARTALAGWKVRCPPAAAAGGAALRGVGHAQVGALTVTYQAFLRASLRGSDAVPRERRARRVLGGWRALTLAQQCRARAAALVLARRGRREARAAVAAWKRAARDSLAHKLVELSSPLSRGRVVTAAAAATTTGVEGGGVSGGANAIVGAHGASRGRNATVGGGRRGAVGGGRRRDGVGRGARAAEQPRDSARGARRPPAGQGAARGAQAGRAERGAGGPRACALCRRKGARARDRAPHLAGERRRPWASGAPRGRRAPPLRG